MKQSLSRLKPARAGMVLIAALSAFGCRTVPFDSVPRVPVQAWTPDAVRTEYADRLEPSFEWRHAMTFEFPFFRMAALGIAAGNRAEETFALACFTHTGVTLFELEDDGTSTRTDIPSRFGAASLDCADVTRFLLKRLANRRTRCNLFTR